MNTNGKTVAEAPADLDFTEEVRARVPEWMKEEIAKLAASRLLGAPDIVREALAEYLKRHQHRMSKLEIARRKAAAA